MYYSLVPRVYIDTLRVYVSCTATRLYLVPHHFHNNRLSSYTDNKYLRRVYFNNFLSIGYTVFVITQYFMATELLVSYKHLMINALNLGVAIAVHLLISLLIFQNIFVCEETLKVWNSAYVFLRKFEGKFNLNSPTYHSQEDSMETRAVKAWNSTVIP